MKRDAHPETGARTCNCKAPRPSSSPSSAAYLLPPLGADGQWTQPLTGGAGDPRAFCRNCKRRLSVTPHRRLAPVPKSKGKVKGARKARSCDVALNHLSWRVVDRGADGMVRAGVSASGIVGYLEGYPREEEEDGYDEEVEQGGAFGESDYYGEIEMGRDVVGDETAGGAEEGEATGEGIEEDSGGGVGIGETDEMGFYQVGFVWDYVDEDDWCVVGEL